MNVGFMFFDDSKKSLAEKIRAHAARYYARFGEAAELCLVNPSMLADGQVLEVDKITVRAWRPILPHHLWLGVEEKPTEKKESVPA